MYTEGSDQIRQSDTERLDQAHNEVILTLGPPKNT